MRKPWLLFLLLILPYTLKSEIAPQNYLSILPVQSWCRPSEVPSVSEEDLVLGSNGYYYLLVEAQNHADKKEFYHHIAYKITNPTGIESSSEISVNFDPSFQKISFHSIKVTRNGKTVSRLKLNNFKIIQREANLDMHLYDGSLNAHFILEDIRVGDQIEYDYTLYGSNPIYEGKFHNWFYLQYGDPVKLLYHKYIYSDKQHLYHKTIGQSGVKLPEAVQSSENGLRALVWKWENVPPIMQENNVPEWHFSYPFVVVSTFANWAEVAKWSTRVFESTNTVLPQEFNQKLENWKKTSHSLGTVVDSLLLFVKDSIRYMGIEMGENAIKPSAPALVLGRRFGDCKDKSLLLASALKKLGFEASPALVSTYAKYSMPDWLPTPSAFNHCIVYAKISGKDYWFDPTVTGQRGSFDKMYSPNYKWALLIKPTENALKKMEGPHPSSISVEEEFLIPGFYEKARLKVKTEYEGADADEQRNYFQGNKENIKKNYEDFYSNRIPHIAITYLETEDHPASNIFTVYEEYEIDSLWAEDSTQPGVLTAAFFPQVIGQKLGSYTSTANRKMPFRIDHPTKISEILTIYLPEEWSSTDIPLTIDNQFCHFSQEISCKARTTVIKYFYETKTDVVQAHEYKRYNQEQEKIYNNLGYTLTYNLNATETGPTSSSHTNWLLVFFSFGLIFFVYLLCKLIYRYDPDYLTFQPENLPIGGALVLLGIALCLSPIKIGYQIYQNNYFDFSAWNSVMNPDSTTYNPLLGIVVLVELFYNLFLLGFFFLLNFLFYQRRTSFRQLFTLYYPINLVVSVLFEVVINLASGTSNYFEDSKGYLQLIVMGAVWITYLYQSKRVPHTFSTRLAPPND